MSTKSYATARSLELSVVNDTGGIDVIDSVLILLPIVPGFTQGVAATKLPDDGKIIVTHYSREDSILSGQASSTMFKFRLMPANDSITKIGGFGKYLRDRKKAAVLRMKDGSDCYILPPTLDRDLLTQGLSCLSSSCLGEPVTPAAKSSSSSSCGDRSGVDSGKLDEASVKPKSFLSNLLSKVGTYERATPKVDNRQSVVDHVMALENNLRAQLIEFVADDGCTSLELDPMDRDMRFVCHDVVSNFEHLVSASTGEEDLRHVVVYKKGYEPADAELHLPQGYKVITGRGLNHGRSKKDDTYEKPIAVTNFEYLNQVNVIKRDRRTIEEIQQDMKKKPKADETTKSSNEY